jgi:hypothetical protein
MARHRNQKRRDITRYDQLLNLGTGNSEASWIVDVSCSSAHVGPAAELLSSCSDAAPYLQLSDKTRRCPFGGFPARAEFCCWWTCRPGCRREALSGEEVPRPAGQTPHSGPQPSRTGEADCPSFQDPDEVQCTVRSLPCEPLDSETFASVAVGDNK